MFFLGVLSIIQMICLPGLIVTAFLPIPGRGIARWISVFGISLLVNYLLVVLLTLLHLYTQIILLIICAGELVAVFWLYRKRLSFTFETVSVDLIERFSALKPVHLRAAVPSQALRLLDYVLFLALLIFAAADIFWLFKICIYNIGTVFNAWDAILSYNQWAVAWSQGLFPSATSYYPQLIPANWSMAYVLLNHAELQYFPKFMMPLFSLFILLMLLDLALQTRDTGFLIAIILTRLMIKRFTGEYINDGVMDLPAAFFGFACIYLLLRARLETERNRFNPNWIIASGIMAAAAALTKQAGIIILLLLPALIWLLVLQSETSLTAKQKNRLITTTFGGAFLAAAAWYLYKFINIQLGSDSSNIAYVTFEIYRGAGMLERALAAYASLAKYGALLIAVIPALLLVKPHYRWLGGLVVIPYALIWLFFFSYETRTLALIFPLWAMLIGLALRKLLDFALSFAARLQLQKTTVLAIPILALLAAAAGAFFFPPTRLAAIQEDRQWQILDPGLNAEIRTLVKQTGTDIHILSQYPVGMLPGMQNTQISFWYNNLPDFLQALQNPHLDYLLVPATVAGEIEAALQAGVEAGNFDLLFTYTGAYPNRMYRVNH